jgi:hypothetical protein
MSKFAKLFEVDEIGQILVMQDTNGEGSPAVKVFFEPPNLGVCCISLAFSDDDSGWDKCDKTFSRMDQDMAVEAVKSQLGMIRQAGIKSQ